MAQRDPLVEFQREGFDMFAAMMDGIREESVGFLFNLDVEVDDGTGATAPAATGAPASHGNGAGTRDGDAPDNGEPKIDASLLHAAQEAHDEDAHAAPKVSAEGLDRREPSTLTYSSPELGSENPSVTTKGGQRPSAKSATAKRQRARNPNRGSRGNGGARGGKRKR